MKTRRITLFVASLMISALIRAQVPNAGFESWTAGNPDGWACSNVPAAGLINIFQSTDSHTGNYACRGNVVDFYGTPMGPVIQSGPAARGFAVSQQYHSLELYYKFAPLGGDRFAVNAALLKNGNPIAQAIAALPATVDAYTHLTVPFNYTTTDTPDTCIIQISINGPTTGTDLHVGSVMYVDDLLLSLSTGTGPALAATSRGKPFPDPAVDIIHIPVPSDDQGPYSIIISDLQGRVIQTDNQIRKERTDNSISVSIRDLPVGGYFFMLRGQGKSCTGKFTVIH
jgi:hypothetical protein